MALGLNLYKQFCYAGLGLQMPQRVLHSSLHQWTVNEFNKTGMM